MRTAPAASARSTTSTVVATPISPPSTAAAIKETRVLGRGRDAPVLAALVLTRIRIAATRRAHHPGSRPASLGPECLDDRLGRVAFRRRDSRRADAFTHSRNSRHGLGLTV